MVSFSKKVKLYFCVNSEMIF